jgi:hypothetical protein
VKLWSNGVYQASGTKTASGSSFANATTGYRIGWLTTGDTTNLHYYDGNIAEMVGWNTTINDAQRQQMEGLSRLEVGPSRNLPAGHPFAIVPPTP